MGLRVYNYGNISSGNVAITSPSCTNKNNKRSQKRLFVVLGLVGNVLLAASYLLLPSAENDGDLSSSWNHHRSLAESATAEEQRRAHRQSHVGKSYVPTFEGWGEWPTWGPVQHTFRRLCTADERSTSYRRSLSLAAVDQLVPDFVASLFSGGRAEENRLKRFLACNVGKLG